LTSRRILISANSAWYLANFRSPIISAMVEAGYEVVAAANPDPAVAELEAIGCRFEPIRIDSKGLSPLRDAATFLSYLRLMRRVRPDVFVGSTIKPNIYGGMAAAILGIPAVNDISGLGTAFIRKSWVTAVAERLYRLGLARAHAVFFQNIHDRALFLERGLVRPEQARLIPGSGVNLDRFAPAGVPAGRAEGTTFLLIGRLLADKGVFEYVEAARSLKRERPDLRFLLLGFLGAENRTAVSETAPRS
jgi:glycosyltransferase involved in cell wall biosynthesis